MEIVISLVFSVTIIISIQTMRQPAPLSPDGCTPASKVSMIYHKLGQALSTPLRCARVSRSGWALSAADSASTRRSVLASFVVLPVAALLVGLWPANSNLLLPDSSTTTTTTSSTTSSRVVPSHRPPSRHVDHRPAARGIPDHADVRHSAHRGRSSESSHRSQLTQSRSRLSLVLFARSSDSQARAQANTWLMEYQQSNESVTTPDRTRKEPPNCAPHSGCCWHASHCCLFDSPLVCGRLRCSFSVTRTPVFVSSARVCCTRRWSRAGR